MAHGEERQHEVEEFAALTYDSDPVHDNACAAALEQAAEPLFRLTVAGLSPEKPVGLRTR